LAYYHKIPVGNGVVRQAFKMNKSKVDGLDGVPIEFHHQFPCNAI